MAHEHCKHDLSHCEHCDVVTCSKCKREWGAEKPCNLNHYPTYIPYYPPPVFPTWRPAPYWTNTFATGGTNMPQGVSFGGLQSSTNTINQLGSG